MRIPSGFGFCRLRPSSLDLLSTEKIIEIHDALPLKSAEHKNPASRRLISIDEESRLWVRGPAEMERPQRPLSTQPQQDRAPPSSPEKDFPDDGGVIVASALEGLE